MIFCLFSYISGYILCVELISCPGCLLRCDLVSSYPYVNSIELKRTMVWIKCYKASQYQAITLTYKQLAYKNVFHRSNHISALLGEHQPGIKCNKNSAGRPKHGGRGKREEETGILYCFGVASPLLLYYYHLRI